MVGEEILSTWVVAKMYKVMYILLPGASQGDVADSTIQKLTEAPAATND